MDVDFDIPVDITNNRSSVGADLISDLITLRGNEYEGLFVAESIRGGQTIRVLQRQDFRIFFAGYKTWSTGDVVITLGTFITQIMSLTASNPVVDAFGIVFDVAASVYSDVPGSGRVDKYNCVANVGRYTSINGSQYAYTMTDSVFSYMGYDDNNLNSTAHAAIDSSSMTQYYTDSFSYYYSSSQQIEDAYNNFLAIGQMD